LISILKSICYIHKLAIGKVYSKVCIYFIEVILGSLLIPSKF